MWFMETSDESDDFECVEEDMLVLIVVCGLTVLRCDAIAERGPLVLVSWVSGKWKYT